MCVLPCLSFFTSRRRHTRCLSDWSSDVCSSDLCHREPIARTDVPAVAAEILIVLPPNSSHVPAVVANRVLVQIVGYVEHLWVSAGVRRRSSGASRSHAPAWALPQIPLTSPPPRACRPEPDPTASHRVWQCTREASRPRTCRLSRRNSRP